MNREPAGGELRLPPTPKTAMDQPLRRRPRRNRLPI
jgi:hypothetical protein